MSVDGSQQTLLAVAYQPAFDPWTSAAQQLTSLVTENWRLCRHKRFIDLVLCRTIHGSTDQVVPLVPTEQKF
jgi:hypothetical protein